MSITQTPVDIDILLDEADILRGMHKVFTDNGIAALRDPTKTIFDTWKSHKRYLIRKLARSSMWVPDACAVVSRITPALDVDECLKWLGYISRQVNCKSGISEEHIDAFNIFIQHACRRLNGNSIYADKEMSDALTGTICGIKPKQKISRVLSSTLDSFCKYMLCTNAQRALTGYNDFARAIPSDTTYTIVLSLHPCDYLLMSNGNSWSSCHRLNDGEYASGTLSYMLDRPSMVCYMLPSKTEISNNIYSTPKIYRCMYHYADGLLLQSRLYSDNTRIQLRNSINAWVQSVIAECEGKPNMWGVFDRSMPWCGMPRTSQVGTHYKDYLSAEYRELSALPNIFNKEKLPMLIGASPICPECGATHGCSGVLCDNCGEYDE